MATHRKTTAAAFMAEANRAERDTRSPSKPNGEQLPAWMLEIRQAAANDVLASLPAKRETVYECPKCHAMSVRVEGTRWRCTGAECARGGDTLELVSRGLHGTVYFRLTPAQKQGVRRWCVDFLGGAL